LLRNLASALREQNWLAVLIEVFVVVTGIVLALEFDNWNEGRKQSVEEREVLTNIISNLESDIQSFDFRLRALDEKEDSLMRVRSVLAGEIVRDPEGFLMDVIIGANYGWNQGQAQRATFNELLGAGRLSLISEGGIRSAVVSYYEEYETEHIRIEERETEYPKLSYQLVPRGRGVSKQTGLAERELEAGLSDQVLTKISDDVRASKLSNYVTAEINLARFIRGVTRDLRSDAKLLISRLQAYKADY
jgi:hypothetical protein